MTRNEYQLLPDYDNEVVLHAIAVSTDCVAVDVEEEHDSRNDNTVVLPEILSKNKYYPVYNCDGELTSHWIPSLELLYDLPNHETEIRIRSYHQHDPFFDVFHDYPIYSMGVLEQEFYLKYNNLFNQLHIMSRRLRLMKCKMLGGLSGYRSPDCDHPIYKHNSNYIEIHRLADERFTIGIQANDESIKIKNLLYRSWLTRQFCVRGKTYVGCILDSVDKIKELQNRANMIDSNVKRLELSFSVANNLATKIE